MLSSEQVKRFTDEGFLALPEALSSSAIMEVRNLLDPLFASFSQLSPAHTRDLTGEGRPGLPRSAEIDRPLRLERRLQSTEAYLRCLELARHLGGQWARYSYNHAIYKAPFNNGETPWHQDHAYTGHGRLLRTMHFWIPLQPATIENGCMQFVAGSHVNGLLVHARGRDGHVRKTTVADGTPRVACPLPVGGVTVHSPLTLHYTGPNQTADVRRAWIVHFGPWGRLAKLHPGILFEKIVARLARQAA